MLSESVIVFSLFCGAVAAAIAHTKNRSRRRPDCLPQLALSQRR
jgi:hypothetical protein